MPLPTPIGRQHDVLYLPAAGHLVVLGTAGSGKTTIALWRAAYLANTRFDHGGRTLLVTFNKALVTYLRHLGQGAIPGVRVENYHTFARGYVHSRTPMPSRNGISEGARRTAYIQAAIDDVRTRWPEAKVMNRPIAFFEDEIHWIASHGIATPEPYVQTERLGRANANLARRDRPAVYEVYQRYRELRNAGGQPYDWDELASAALQEFRKDPSERFYRHIVIDEGQDFSPEMLRSLAAAVPPNGSVSFFGDYAQQVYGTRMSWRQAGLDNPTIEYFKQNYRNTRPIARLALAIAAEDYFSEVPDLVEPTDAIADGPKPTLVEFKSQPEEIDFVVAQAARLASSTSVAVLFRDRADEAKVARYLPSPKIRLHRKLNHWVTGPALYYGTYHSAKGMEFEHVLLPFCSEDRLPQREDVTVLGLPEARARDGRLLYVGVTRARSGLVMTYTQARSTLLPADPKLYALVQR